MVAKASRSPACKLVITTCSDCKLLSASLTLAPGPTIAMGLPFSAYELGACVRSRLSWGALLATTVLLLVRLDDRVPLLTRPLLSSSSAFNARATVLLPLGLV